MSWGHQPEQQNEGIFQKGDILKCMIVGFPTFPKDYLTELDAANAVERERCEERGVECTEQVPTYKNGGMSLRIAIIERNNEKLITQEKDGSIVFPDYSIKHTIEVPCLRRMYAERNNRFNLGGTDSVENNIVVIDELLPSAKPVYTYDNAAKKYIYHQDKGGLQEGYSLSKNDLMKLENKIKARQKQWEAVLSFYEMKSEDECIKEYEDTIQRAFMICNLSKGKVSYIKLIPGVTFMAINKSSKPNFAYPVVCDWANQGNNFYKTSYSLYDSHEPSKEEFNFAYQIGCKFLEDELEQAEENQTATSDSNEEQAF